VVQHLTDAGLLELWERGREAGPVARALLLLGAARPELGEDERLALPLPTRDAALLELRIALHGPRLPGCVDCPRCGETLEFELDGEQLRQAACAGPRDEIAVAGLRFRLPNSGDLLAAAAAGGEDDAALVLMRRCCLAAPAGHSWSPATLAEVEERMEQQAVSVELQLRLQCQVCAHAWGSVLDIAAWLWEESEQHVRALLDEVDRLAAAYHWAERDILALSPARRRAYLQRCDS
jgi:hypothetical protein